jgi:hypothetical protein
MNLVEEKRKSDFFGVGKQKIVVDNMHKLITKEFKFNVNHHIKIG